jgi:hypothetical protein
LKKKRAGIRVVVIQTFCVDILIQWLVVLYGDIPKEVLVKKKILRGLQVE